MGVQESESLAWSLAEAVGRERVQVDRMSRYIPARGGRRLAPPDLAAQLTDRDRFWLERASCGQGVSSRPRNRLSCWGLVVPCLSHAYLTVYGRSVAMWCGICTHVEDAHWNDACPGCGRIYRGRGALGVWLEPDVTPRIGPARDPLDGVRRYA